MTGTKTGPMLRQADEGADQIALVGPEDEFGGAGNGRRRDPERIENRERSQQRARTEALRLSLAHGRAQGRDQRTRR